MLLVHNPRLPFKKDYAAANRGIVGPGTSSCCLPLDNTTTTYYCYKKPMKTKHGRDDISPIPSTGSTDSSPRPSTGSTMAEPRLATTIATAAFSSALSEPSVEPCCQRGATAAKEKDVLYDSLDAARDAARGACMVAWPADEPYQPLILDEGNQGGR